MASTRPAVRAPPLFTMMSSNGTSGFAAAMPLRHSSSRSIRFQVTSRIDTIGSGIDAGQATQFGDAPYGLDAVATRGLWRRASVEMLEERVELALERRTARRFHGVTIVGGAD